MSHRLESNEAGSTRALLASGSPTLRALFRPNHRYGFIVSRHPYPIGYLANAEPALPTRADLSIFSCWTIRGRLRAIEGVLSCFFGWHMLSRKNSGDSHESLVTIRCEPSCRDHVNCPGECRRLQMHHHYLARFFSGAVRLLQNIKSIELRRVHHGGNENWCERP